MNSEQKARGGNRARVYNLAGKSVDEFDTVVTGNLLVSSYPAFVLFDPGATHSFVSSNFVRKHSIPHSTLEETLRVETPMAL